VGWPDESYIKATLSTIRDAVQKAKITRTALIFIGKGLRMDAAFRDSALYDAAHAHILRPVRGQKAAKT
jgi:precorrin-4/cobalt-precorrin-4 C11-methyltransferase